jgi:beta-lactamase class A
MKTLVTHFSTFVIASILLSVSSFGQNSPEIQPENPPILWDAGDFILQKKLEKVMKQQGLWQQIQTRHLAVAVVDVSNIHAPKLAELNGNKMFYAASLPKIAILLAAFVEIEAGNLEESDQLYEEMTSMIRYSSNTSASRVLSIVGRERTLEILQDPHFALYDSQHNGGLWIGKDYGKSGAYRRDPLHNLSHGATAIQAARFYYLLATNQLLGPFYTKKMKEILSNPGIKHKFVKGLEKVPGIRMYRKSGSWKNYHADSALVEYKEHAYIIVGLSDSNRGGRWLEKLSLPIHKMITGNQ